jgi:hypothetical protein
MNPGISTYPSKAPGIAPDLTEYMLVAYPDADACEQVSLEQEYFLHAYNGQLSPRQRPYITVARFLAKEEMEETLVRWIQRVCSHQHSFSAKLNNFSGYPPHTIYLRIQDPAPFQRLARELQVIDGFVQSNGCPPVTLIAAPHLPIAGKLRDEVYEKAISDYSRRVFHASFEVGELALVKRKGAYENHSQVSIFRLPPPPVEI